MLFTLSGPFCTSIACLYRFVLLRRVDPFLPVLVWYYEAVIGERRWRTWVLPVSERPATADPRERELWAQVAEAERIRDAAPAAPSRADLAAARDAVLHALVLQERLARQVALV